MSSPTSFRSRLLSVLFWSVISAAFIGPGTVTTAAAAGASHQLNLLWALVFSTCACIILQEATARITLVSGYSLGEAIAHRYRGTRLHMLTWLIAGAIILGGVAYQAGNILGAVAGSELISGIHRNILTAIIAGTAGLVLWWGNDKKIAQLMGLVVAVMGLAFIWVAVSSPLDWGLVFTKALSPSIPSGSEWLIIGLVGTTIVPYNLFLASGISKGQTISEMRWGLSIAILIGGVISIAILLVGTQIVGAFSFQALSATMENGLGTWAAVLVGIGLFAAGFTSSITAPMAAAITAKTIWGKGETTWENTGKSYRWVWGIVLMSGLVFGISGIKPVPAIVLAQALNGLLLPFVAIFLLIVVNDPKIMPSLNPLISNLLLLVLVGITILLGATNVLKAAYAATGIPFSAGAETIGYLLGFASVISIGLGVYVYRLRRNV